MGVMGSSKSAPKNMQPELSMVERATLSSLSLAPALRYTQNPRGPPRGSHIGVGVRVLAAAGLVTPAPAKPHEPLVIVKNDSLCSGRESQASIRRKNHFHA